MMPRVFSVIAFIGQMMVVVAGLFLGSVGDDPITAIPNLKPAFHEQRANSGCGFNAQPFHAFPVRRGVGLPTQNGAHTQRSQMIAQCHFAHAQRMFVPQRSVRACIAACIKARPTGAANRGLHISAVETNATCCQGINIWCADVGMPCATKIVVPQLITHYKQDLLGHQWLTS